MAQRMITALATLHGVDFEGCGLGDLGRPEGYLERQVRRFAGLWERGRTRDLPELDEVTAWLQEHLPESGAPALVHGDFRIGNLLFCSAPPVRLLGIVDWEMATLGDPLADVGYLCAHLAERGDPGTVMTELQPVTREDGFPDSCGPGVALRRAHRPLGRAPRLVPRAGGVEVGDLPRAELRPVSRRQRRGSVVRRDGGRGAGAGGAGSAGGGARWGPRL